MKPKQILFCIILIIAALLFGAMLKGPLPVILAGIGAVAWLGFVLGLWAVMRPMSKSEDKSNTGSKFISWALVPLILLLPLKAQAQSDPGHDRDPKTSLCGVIIGCTVIVTGGYIAYELWQLCQRQFPPPPPAPPPPPPPPPVVTNQPSTVNTNAPATNRPSARLNINPKDVKAVAIEAYGYTAPDGSLYHTMLTMDLATSSTLKDWEPVSVVAYISTNNVLTQVGKQGAVIRPYTLNWELDVGLNEPGTPMKFLRSATP